MWVQIPCLPLNCTMVSVVYVVGTPVCEAGGKGSTPFGHPLVLQECASGTQAASKTAQQGSIPGTPAGAIVLSFLLAQV